jgi:hypothetical protein
VKFILETDGSASADPQGESARILRYWGGAMKHIDSVKPGDGLDVYDSGYAKVGWWALAAGGD